MAESVKTAFLKCYYDSDCKYEVENSDNKGSNYLVSLGPAHGLNGSSGDYSVQNIYVKNIGAVKASNVVFREIGDLGDYFRLSVNDGPVVSVKTILPVLQPEEVALLKLYAIIPKGIKSSTGNIIYSIEYESDPDIQGPQETIDPEKISDVYLQTMSALEYEPFVIGKTYEIDDVVFIGDYLYRYANEDKSGLPCTSFIATDWEVITQEEASVLIAASDKRQYFTGYSVAQDEEGLYEVGTSQIYHLEGHPGQEKHPQGQPYGGSTFGNPNYGQAGLIHCTMNINSTLYIRGILTSTITASYNIKTRYMGDEPNLEDVQSFYTDRYMKLGCYDGPALPLWTDKRS